MSNISLTNYVKFVRGTPTAFNKLASKDIDTLYFISEKDAATGKLYLGSKLISGGVTSESNLGDVIISAIGDKQILVYDANQGAWVNQSLNTIVKTMVGATAETDGQSGLVPKPLAEDRDKFLTGSGTWVDPTTALNIDENIFSKENGQLTLAAPIAQAQPGDLLSIGLNNKITWTTPNVYTKDEIDNLLNGRLTRKKVDSLDDIDVEADDADQYIYMVPNGITDGTDVYNEYIIIDGKIEKIGNSSVDFDGYVTTEALNNLLKDYVSSGDFTPVAGKVTELDKILNGTPATDDEEEVKGLVSVVGELKTSIDGLNDNYVTLSKYNAEVGDLTTLIRNVTKESGDSTLVEEINDINERLRWNDLQDEESE